MLSAQSVALETRIASINTIRLSKELEFYWLKILEEPCKFDDADQRYRTAKK